LGSKEIVLGCHIIITAYGFWLPNDPRGSWSDYVAAWELFRFAGKATKVDTRRSVANRPHDREARLSAKRTLKWPAVTWDGKQAVAISRGFKEVARHWGLWIYACSVLPEHVHLVIGRCDRNIRQVMNQFKGRASQQMVALEIHPFQKDQDVRGERPTCWARKGWNVFLDSHSGMRKAIEYVEENPSKEGKRRQTWSFIQPYHG